MDGGLVLVLVGGRAAKGLVAGEGGGGDGNEQHHRTNHDQQLGSAVDPVPHGGVHKEDPGKDSRDDGHHHGGHQQAFVPGICSCNGKTPGDEEEDEEEDRVEEEAKRGSICREVAAAESTFGEDGDDATDDVESTEHCCCLGTCCSPVVRVRLIGRLRHVDRLVGGVGDTLLHYNRVVDLTTRWPVCDEPCAILIAISC